MKDDYRARLRDNLNPEALSKELIRAGTLLTGYELVKTAIMDDVKGFYTLGFNDPRLDRRYHQEVLTLGPNKLQASLNWLVSNGALTSQQVHSFEVIRGHRGELAHELAGYLIDPDDGVRMDLVDDLYEIVKSLDRFWGPIHVAASPDFDGKSVDIESDFHSGTRLLFELLLPLA